MSERAPSKGFAAPRPTARGVRAVRAGAGFEGARRLDGGATKRSEALQSGEGPSSAGLTRSHRSHARWRELAETLEELVVALADKLWKGARVVELEELVIDRAAAAARRDRWDLHVELDSLFESVASGADGRLERSAV